eukprot:TRINITY_DN105111_c0_g1_i1.p1 TRINITY_DN105111_c0_g1~~TRINITY_DN105111_c0_g1_i1.p1  ORF type:complete len:401 (-),score=58.81 TRINITY_DN105111_c0_g1_i1:454-1656(-)
MALLVPRMHEMGCTERPRNQLPRLSLFLFVGIVAGDEVVDSPTPCDVVSDEAFGSQRSRGCGNNAGRMLTQSSLYYENNLHHTLRTRAEHLNYIEAEYKFGVVADLDLLSRDPQEFIWRSYLKKGRVVRLSSRPQRDRFTLVWDEELELQSSTATRNRSMELSELVLYKRLLLGFCDYSGIAYKIEPETGKTFQRWAIADGDGNEPKPFKAEWATVKGDTIWLGSIGFEWYGKNGEILHRNAEWVKIIDGNGLIRNLDWHPVYQAIRSATNTTLPGYLWHEAVEWEPVQRLWVMLPRFASSTSTYTPGLEHQDTSSMLIVADEAFHNIQVRSLKYHEPGFGFTSVKRLPGSRNLFVVLRVKEQAASSTTQAAIIDLHGNFYTDPPYVQVGERKYEGLAFL